MKKLIPLFALIALAAPLTAQDVALIDIRFKSDKSVRKVALEFHEQDAPIAVENFKKLAKKGFYKGLAFHRVFPNTLVQVGDPLSKKKKAHGIGTGGPGYTLPAEIRGKHTKGAVAAARLPDKVNPQRRSNGSQFYICLAPQSQLNGQYTVFAHVIQGMDVLEAISNKPADTNDSPVERITIKKIKIIPREELPEPVVAAPAAAGTPKKSWWRWFWPW